MDRVLFSSSGVVLPVLEDQRPRGAAVSALPAGISRLPLYALLRGLQLQRYGGRGLWRVPGAGGGIANLDFSAHVASGVKCPILA